MELEYDLKKRAKTLAERGLDFKRANELFSDFTLTILDDRFEYGEDRFQTIGLLDGEPIMMIWTPRGLKRRIISMRKCDAKECKYYFEERLDGS